METAVNLAPPVLNILDLGRIDYAECWQLQKDLQKQRIADLIPDTLILCEHEPVVTFGRSSTKDQLLYSKEELARRGINFFEVERGGAVTYHGPGQLVVYPILDLKQHKRDVDWYMRQLEQVIINTLASVNISAVRNPGFTGVWVTGQAQKLAKIAAIGVRLSRWCSMHGLALNILPQNMGFECIVPCGIQNVEITCIETELHKMGLSNYNDLSALSAQVKRSSIDDFLKVFNYSGSQFVNL